MKKRVITEKDYIKAVRRASREAEIADHGKPLARARIHRSKRLYNRKKAKAVLNELP
jgi:hypothetical protein